MAKKTRDQYIQEHDEDGSGAVSFSIINPDVIKRRQKEGDIRLPRKKVNVPKDERWNTKQMNSKLLQGILNGDSIPKIAKSLTDVIGNNKVSATRNARTMITQAECAGRLDSYENLSAQGVVQKKVWIATPDNRTRDSHLEIDGEEVDIEQKFGNGLMYPADPSGNASEVYNCRCSMRTHIIGFRKADGTITEIKNQRDDTMHADLMQAEKDRRKAKVQEKAEKQTEPAEKDEKEILHGDKDAYDRIMRKAEASNIAHKDVKELDEPLTRGEIIDKLAGGDKTKGSCSSLSMAYCANNVGLDVTDFRGGDSQSLFARNINIPDVYKAAGAEVMSYDVKREAKDVANIIRGIDENREYVLRTGKHAAIIRKIDDHLEYLEMQSASYNGWKTMEYNTRGRTRTIEDTLHERFGCRKTVDRDRWDGTIYEKNALLIPVDTVKPTSEFKEIMGYIDTDSDKQQKGTSGYAR